MFKTIFNKFRELLTDGHVTCETPTLGLKHREPVMETLKDAGFIGLEVDPAHYAEALEQARHLAPPPLPRDLAFNRNWARFYNANEYVNGFSRWSSSQGYH